MCHYYVAVLPGLLLTGVIRMLFYADDTFLLTFEGVDRLDIAKILLLTREDAFESNTWIIAL